MSASIRFWILFCAIAAAPKTLAVDWDVLTPLDEYVHHDDGHYKWTEIVSYNYIGVTLYVVNMTSQMYQTDAYSTQSIWWHQVGIAIPDVITHPEGGILYIDGGGNTNYNPPERDDTTCVAMAAIANDTGIISGFIKAVPNQPIHFHNDPTFRRRSEDSIIAWTWRTFVDSAEPSDPTVILRMPMTKAAKRALDTIQAVSAIRAPSANPSKFVITGASKRGWTTWSLAATDRRVVGIAPMVFSLLNFDDHEGGGTLMNHFQNMDGAWSFALAPYWNENLTQEFFNPKATRLFEVEDMFYYRERFTMPILEMVSTGDEFFLTDDNHHWWDQIPSTSKYLMMLPNAEHSMAPHYVQIYASAVSFVLHIFEEIPFPQVSWTMDAEGDKGSIHLWTNPAPRNIKAFSAVTLANDTRRDFRLASGTPDAIQFHPVIWKQNLFIDNPDEGHYSVEATTVEGEWVGFFLEAEWEGPSGYRFTLTTQVNIIPYTYPPHGPCDSPATCYGTLV